MTVSRRLRGLAALLLLPSFLTSGGCGDNGAGGGAEAGWDRFGGWRAVRSTATGRFRVEQIGGHWWFITPEGNAFFSTGVNGVRAQGDFSPPIGRAPYHEAILARYGSEQAWAAETLRRLRAWNFNTIGAWSDIELFPATLPYVLFLEFHTAAPEIPGWSPGLTGKRLRDYFGAEWAEGARRRAERAVACAEDPYCVGVFTDNELPWGPGVLQLGTQLDAYMTLPETAAGKAAVVAFFRDRYAGDITAFNHVWEEDLGSFDDLLERDRIGPPGVTLLEEPAERRADRFAFLALVAERYFSVVHDALRSTAPGVLILGSRFVPTLTHPVVYRACGPYVDVVSLNDYELPESSLLALGQVIGADQLGYLFFDGAFGDLAAVHDLTGKPILITEFFYRVRRPDVASIPFGFPEVEMREEQADAYERYMNEMLARPFIVGVHWFKYSDQPVTGRFDGENQLIGLVDIEDEPYPLLTERMREVNGRAFAQRLGMIAPPPGSATSGGSR